MVDYHGTDVVPLGRLAWPLLALLISACDPLLPPGVMGTDSNSFVGCAKSLTELGAQTLCLSNESRQDGSPGEQRLFLIGIESESSCLITTPTLELALGAANSTLISDRLYQCNSGRIRETSLTTLNTRSANISCSKLTSDGSNLLVIANNANDTQVTAFKTFDALIEDESISSIKVEKRTNASFAVLNGNLLQLEGDKLQSYDVQTGATKRMYEMTLSEMVTGVSAAGNFLAVLRSTSTNFRIALLSPPQNYNQTDELVFEGDFKNLKGLACIDKDSL